MKIRHIITEADQLGLPEFRGFLTDEKHVAAWAREHEQQIKSFIKQHCSRWVNESRNIPVWRGFKTPDPHPAFVRSIRRDRRPRDSDPQQHRWLNALLTIAGSPATRQNSLFVTGIASQAASYGPVHRVFMMGDYHYAWMPGEADWGEMSAHNGHINVLDLIDSRAVVGSFEFEDLINSGVLDPVVSKEELPDLDPDEVVDLIWDEFADKIDWLNPEYLDRQSVKRFIKVNQGLDKAITTGAELMVTGQQAFSLDWTAANAIGLGE